MRRFVTVPLIVFGVMFALITFYFRMRTVQQLDLALSLIDDDPSGAYQILEPLLVRGHFPKLGRIETAQGSFIERLYDRCIDRLRQRPPGAGSFRGAQQTVLILRRMEGLKARNADVYRRNILQAARDAANSVESDGTLDSWDAMIEMFQYVQTRDLIPVDARQAFSEWIAQAATPEARRRLALRDTLRQVPIWLKAGLDGAGAVPEGAGAPLLRSLPAHLSDDAMHLLYDSIGQSWYSLSVFRAKIEGTMPPPLRKIEALLQCNEAGIYANHLIDPESSAIRRRSGFVASLTIDSFSPAVPDPNQMFNTFVNQAHENLDDARERIQNGPFTQDEAAALWALCLHDEILMDRALGRPTESVEAQFRQTMQWLISKGGASPLAAAIRQELQEHPRRIPFFVGVTGGPPPSDAVKPLAAAPNGKAPAAPAPAGASAVD